MLRQFGIAALAASVIGSVGEMLALQLPTLRWPFNTAREMPMLSAEAPGLPDFLLVDGHFLWFGWVFYVVLAVLGLCLMRRYPAGAVMPPLTQRRWERFRSVRRGYWSLIVLLGIMLIAGLDQAVVGKRPLVAQYEGAWSFPAFERRIYTGADFGVEGDRAAAEADYRALRKRFEGSNNWLLMPLVPFDSTGDTVTHNMVDLELRDGRLMGPHGGRYDGLASFVYAGDASREHVRFRYRDGLRQGEAEGRDPEGKRCFSGNYVDGELVRYELDYGDAGLEAFMALSDQQFRKIYYNPAPPLAAAGHYLGTNSSGNDIVAYLYGGLQVNIKAVLIYVPIVYVIGVTVGLLMGLYGGSFDLLVQRLIEVFSNIPFLFVVIIFSSMVPVKMKGLGIILFILVLFGWMGMTSLMRTAALKEKARDYVAAARVSGASTWRVVFVHILPNTVSILVTLIPFSVSGIVLSLTSLDYLGFGLPESYATWGRLLNDGLTKLSSPWIVSSAFVTLVLTLVLVTFVGEAVREAYDPKKFTLYK
ncbi:ABC transporter permease subunit [Rubritalea marina]|uniref:ABC transporter permease subunit n=1 Tax=Rubritalea marina TaxID=361055 RepID=UPI0003703840|nr:ABC transporter permease subunit [Rubritalea marina]